MNVRVDLNCPIKDGTEIVFRSPVDCSQVTGLKVYYIGADGIAGSQEFAFADAHGNNVGDIDHLFAENVVVKVILDVTTGMAFVQNADTNAYLEGRFSEAVTHTKQSLTEEEKAQARENIGVDTLLGLKRETHYIQVDLYAEENRYEIGSDFDWDAMVAAAWDKDKDIVCRVVSAEGDDYFTEYSFQGLYAEDGYAAFANVEGERVLTLNIFTDGSVTVTISTTAGSGGGSAEGAVLYTAQTLTDAQKNQARANIGAAAEGETGGESDTLVVTFTNRAEHPVTGEVFFTDTYRADYEIDEILNSTKPVVAKWYADGVEHKSDPDDFVVEDPDGIPTIYIGPFSRYGGDDEWTYTAPKALAQPDWNQTDETAADFIKNRTHYASETVILEPQTVTFEGEETFVDCLAGFSAGDVITVTMDGVSTEYTAFIEVGYPAFGDANTFDPFLCFFHENQLLFMHSLSGDKTVEITKKTIKRLDAEYIPNDGKGLTINVSLMTLTADKTYQEIVSAINAGANVVLRIPVEGTYEYFTLSAWKESVGVIFTNTIINSSGKVEQYNVTIATDGSANVETTTAT